MPLERRAALHYCMVAAAGRRQEGGRKSRCRGLEALCLEHWKEVGAVVVAVAVGA